MLEQYLFYIVRPLSYNYNFQFLFWSLCYFSEHHDTSSLSHTMSNLRLDHIPLLEGAQNYQDWSKSMRYTLLGEDLWTYVSEGTDSADLVNLSTFAPQLSPSGKSSEDVMSKVQAFIVSDAKANAIIRCRISPLASSNIPAKCEDSSRLTWVHLRSTYDRIDAMAQFALHSSISSLRLKDASDAERYFGDFNQAREQLLNAGVVYTESGAVYHLLFGIPDIGSWAVFKQLTLATITAGGTSLLLVIIMSEQICAHIVAESQHVAGPSAPPGPGSEFANVGREQDCMIRKHGKNPGSVKCTNCGKSSHDANHCFEAGGGMAGQKPDWMSQCDASRASSKTCKPWWWSLQVFLAN